MASNGRPTLKHVAERSGVSLISVSRVIRGAPNVSISLKNKVERAARELGYKPNRIAGSLRGQRADLIPVIVPSISNSVFAEVIDGINDRLSSTPFQPLLGISHYSQDQEEEFLRDVLSWSPAAVMLSGLEHNQGTRLLLQEYGCPVVEFFDTDGEVIDSCVGTSQAEAGQIMARHLVEKGYRRIGYVGAWGERPVRSQKRREAFEAALEELGVPLVARQIEDAPSSMAVGANGLSNLLARSSELDAVFFANDDLAIGALFYCKENGISVPGQVALAGFNGLEMCDVITPRLTTIYNPRFEIGIQAGELILDRLKNPNAKPGLVQRLPLAIHIGQTT